MKQYIKRVIKAVLNKPMNVYTAEKTYEISDSVCDEMDGKVAVITGGSGTLGRAICHHLAARGASVYVGGRNIEHINTVVNDVNALGGVQLFL